MEQKGTQTNICTESLQGFSRIGLFSAVLMLLHGCFLARTLGAGGFAYYGAALPLLLFFYILSGCILPLAVFRRLSQDSFRMAQDAFRRKEERYLAAAALCGLLSGAALWALCPLLSGLVKDPDLLLGLRVLCLFTVFYLLSGYLRGYLMIEGAFFAAGGSIAMELCFSLLLSLVLCGKGKAYGELSNLLYEESVFTALYGAAASVLAAGLAAVLTAVCLFGFWLSQRGKSAGRPALRKTAGMQPLCTGAACSAGLPLFLFLLSFLSKNAGGSERLIAGGLGQLLLLFSVPLFPVLFYAAVLSAFTAECAQFRDRKGVWHLTRQGMKFAFVFGFPYAAGLFFLCAPLTRMFFFAEPALTRTVWAVRTGAPFILFGAAAAVSSAVLVGLGYQKAVMKHMLCAFFAAAVLMLLLGRTPLFQEQSVALCMDLFSVCLCLLNGGRMRRTLRYRQSFKRTLLLPFISAASAGTAAWLLKKLLEWLIPENLLMTWIPQILLALLCAAVLKLIYLLLLGVFRVFGTAELRELPFGKSLLRFYRGAGLL